MQPPPPSSTPATGYPYQAPPYPNGGAHQPPQSYPYAAYPQSQPIPQHFPYQNLNTRSFFRAFIATMVCIVVIFGLILIITWLVLRPTLPSFTLTSLSLSSFNTSSSSSSNDNQSLTATWHLSFLVRNRNKKMSITYNSIRAAVFYRSYYLTDSPLPPFKQDTKSETTVNATLSVTNSYVAPSVFADVNNERGRGSVSFNVQVLASTSFRSGSWRFRSRVLKVLCRKVAVGVSSNATSGNLIGSPVECEVWT